MPHSCPVCHYPELHEPPRSPKGGGSFEICPSCGFEHGAADDNPEVKHAAWRKNWVTGGMKWSSKATRPPKGWDPVGQLKKVALAAGRKKVKPKK